MPINLGLSGRGSKGREAMQYSPFVRLVIVAPGNGVKCTRGKRRGVGQIVAAASGRRELRALQARTHKHRTLENCIESPRKVVCIRLQQIPNGSEAECLLHEIGSGILTQNY